jgi:ankyrin repeat protein
MDVTELLFAYVEEFVGTRRITEEPNASIVKILIDAGAVVHARLLHVALRGWPALLSILLQYGHGDANAVNELGQTLLMCAAQVNSFDVFDVLLRAGADVHAVDYQGCTVLHYAARFSWVAILGMLIDEAGSDVDAKSTSGVTSLMEAIRVRRAPHVIEFLLFHSTDKHTHDEEGNSIVDYIDTYTPHMATLPWVQKLRGEGSRWASKREFLELAMLAAQNELYAAAPTREHVRARRQ